MIWVAAVTIGTLAVFCRVIGRSTLYPPAVFAAVWAVALGLLAIAGPLFYRISERTTLVFTLGVAAFALAGLVADHLLSDFACDAPSQVRADRFPVLPGWVLNGMLLILVGAAPLYLLRLTAVVPLDSFKGFLYTVRAQSVGDTASELSQSLGLFANLIPLSIIFVLIGVAGVGSRASHRGICGALFAVTLLYQLSTGGRAGATTLIFSTLAVISLKSARVRLVPIIGSLLVFGLMFSLIAIALGKGNTQRGASLRENLPTLFEGFEWYAVGGLVAFDHIVDNPHAVPSTGGISRTVNEIANKFGADIEIPSLYAQYATIGDEKDTNVYTIYFSYYPDFGLIGSLALIGVVGAVLTAVFRFADRGSPTFLVLYGILFSGMLISVFNESFFTNINLLGKAIVISWCTFATAKRLEERPLQTAVEA